MIYQARSWTVDQNRTPGHPGKSGFTLLEMVVVLAIMAMIVAAAAMSLRKPLQTARLKRAMASLEDADLRARNEARKRSQPVQLVVDGNRNTATHAIAGAGAGYEVRRSLALSGGLRIDRYLTAGRSSNEDRFSVSYSPDGQSNTYAVRVSGDGKFKKWLVVVGATGQYVQSHEDSAVEAILGTQR